MAPPLPSGGVMQTFIAYEPRRADAPLPAGMLLRPIESLCGRAIEPGVRILNVGCGHGFYAGWFASYGCSVVGIDGSAARVGTAGRSNPRARFEVDTVDEALLARLGEEPFDLVISTGSLLEVEDHRAFMRGCFAALREGGRFVGTVPFDGHIRNVARRLSEGWPREREGVLGSGRVRSWTRRPITQLLHDAGFVNVQFRGAGRLPLLWWTMLVSADRPLDRLVRFGSPPLTA